MIKPLEISIQIQLDKVETIKKYVPSVIPYDGKLTITDSSIPQILHDTPPILSFAVYYGAKDIFHYLISNGADVNILDNVHFKFSSNSNFLLISFSLIFIVF